MPCYQDISVKRSEAVTHCIEEECLPHAKLAALRARSCTTSGNFGLLCAHVSMPQTASVKLPAAVIRQ